MSRTRKELREIEEELSFHERRLLLTLKDHDGSTVEKLVNSGGFRDQVEVMNAASWLKSKGLVQIEERVERLLQQGSPVYVERGLPERRALKLLSKAGGVMPLKEFKEKMGEGEAKIAIGHLIRKRWGGVKKKDGVSYVYLTEKGEGMLRKRGEDEKLLERLKSGPIPAEEVDKSLLEELKRRKDVIRIEERVERRIRLTPLGKELLRYGVKMKMDVSQVTEELLRDGRWREVHFRPYDVEAFSPAVWGGRSHPLTVITERIRRIFLEMGFKEIRGNFVEPAFWNMDVLFIPQDHPARDMQDTFYIKWLGEEPDIEEGLEGVLERVGEIHENGGETGSQGWREPWRREEAERFLLRTHTTVNTIRYLYHNPHPPIRVFSVERVFRNEAIDAHHLPEFHQIEGILVEEGASLNMLIGILKEFYRKMGFSEIRVRPSYFPYTEPSLEVEVKYRGEWMELGGAGIFRPEVTLPAGVEEPVLAWGLGLERLAMMVLDLDDIRDLYLSDLKWLREYRYPTVRGV